MARRVSRMTADDKKIAELTCELDQQEGYLDQWFNHTTSDDRDYLLQQISSVETLRAAPESIVKMTTILAAAMLSKLCINHLRGKKK